MQKRLKRQKVQENKKKSINSTSSKMDSSWDVVISSLQDSCNANEELSLDPMKDTTLKGKDQAKTAQVDQILKHQENLEKTKRIIETAVSNIKGLLKIARSGSEIEEMAKHREIGKEAKSGGKNSEPKRIRLSSKYIEAEKSGVHSNTQDKNSGKLSDEVEETAMKIHGRKGRSYYHSAYNPSEPLYAGCEVAFKPKGHNSEWILCEVTRVLSDTKFEVKDPEPDESNPLGQRFKAGWKDVIKIAEANKGLREYPVGSKVLARYPETTTFYPAVVIGAKRDGTCRLKFDGEEEVGKETLVERRLVLPYPARE